jgi:hypothetical protein
MSATMILGVMGAIAAGAVTSLLTKETEGLIDALPGLMLRLARRRLPVDGRDDLYEEWSAELHIALHETEAGRSADSSSVCGTPRDCSAPPVASPTSSARRGTPPRTPGRTPRPSSPAN